MKKDKNHQKKICNDIDNEKDLYTRLHTSQNKKTTEFYYKSHISSHIHNYFMRVINLNKSLEKVK